jgi:hypothetical protein
MAIIRVIIGSLIGALAGAVVGIAITVAYVAVQPPDNPNNPGARAASTMIGLVVVPIGALVGLVKGAKIGLKRGRGGEKRAAR